MKRLLTILACLVALASRAQTIQIGGAPTVQVYFKGQIRVDSCVYLPLRDTTFTPSQVGAVIIKSSNQGLYIWNGSRWQNVPVGTTAWGQLTGSISAQTDLINLFNLYQPLITPGYGIKEVSNTLSFDSAHVRKVDTMYRTNDSTISYTINGVLHTVLVRGTAAGGINSLVLNVPAVLYATPVTFSNSGGAWSGSMILNSQLSNTVLAGPTIGAAAQPTFRTLVLADIPSGIPNSTLANSSIGFTIANSGTAPSWAATPVALGNTAVLNLPFASSTTSGILSSTDWTNFNSAVNPPVTSVNGQLGAVITLSADSLKKLPIDTSADRQGYVLTFDSSAHKWNLTPPGGTGGGTMTSAAMTVPSFLSVAGTPITTSGTFAVSLVNQTANFGFFGPTSGSAAAPTFRAIVNADLPTSGVSAGTYNSVTVNAQGVVTAASIVGSGITSLNGLTGGTQTFATGSSGTNFNIVSTGTVHTFNIPLLNSSDTGLVTPAQKAIWDAKATTTLPYEQVPYGNPSNVQTSSTLMIFDSTQNKLCIGCNTSGSNGIVGLGGATGTATFTSNGGATALVGPTTTVEGTGASGQINLQTNGTNWLSLLNTGELQINGVSGTSGQVPTSAGSGSPIAWGGPFLSTISGITAGGALAGTYPNPGLAGVIASGSCTNCNVTYNAAGQITAATNGSGGGGSIYAIGQLGIGGTDTVEIIDTVWNRKGAIFPDSTAKPQTAEPSVIADVNNFLLGLSSSDTVFKDWYTETNASGYPHVAYAESLTGLPGTWVKYNLDSVISGHYRGSILHNTNSAFGTLGYYYWGVNVAETQVDEYYSSTGGPSTWSLLHSAVITASSLGSSNVYNSWVAIDPASNTWYMLLDVGSTTYGFADYLLSSTDGAGAVWTANATNPVLPRCSGPWFTKLGSTWYCWGHSTMNGAEILPTDGYWWSSSNLTNWTFLGSALPRTTTAEGVNTTVGQVGDLCLVPRLSNVYLFYTETTNGNSSGGALPAVAVYNGTMPTLVSTFQNAPLRGVWNNNGDGSMTYNQGNLSIGRYASKFPLQVGENPGLFINGHKGSSVIEAENFMGADNLVSEANFGNNLFHSTTEGWQLYDSTQVGYTVTGNTSGLTFNYAPSGARLIAQPIAMGVMSNNGTYNILQLGSTAHPGQLVFNGTPDGSANALQMNGYAAEMANMTTGTINTWVFNQSNSTSIPNGNITIWTSKNFAAGLTGNSNIFLGASNTSLTGASTANIIMGGSAGGLLGSGVSYNVAIGSNALANDVTGNFNVALGQTALYGTTGAANVGVGEGAGRSNTTGSNSIYVGLNAGYTDGTITTGTGLSNSAAFGDSAQVLCAGCYVFGGSYTAQKKIMFDVPTATAYVTIPSGLGTAGHAGFQFYAPSIPTTAASGTGTTATVTFAAQTFIPFAIGQTIVVAGVSPSGYNGTAVVTACTLTSVTYLSAGTGAQTVAGTIIPTGKPNSADHWAAGPSGDTIWWVGMSGTLYPLNFPAVSGVTTVGSFNSSSIANGASISGNTITFGPADGTNPGMVKASGSQTLGATITLTNAPVLTTSSTVGQVWTASGTGGQGGWATPQTTTSGTYTPTLTNTTNLTSSSLYQAYYSRNGNIVHVSIGCLLTPTTGSLSTVLTFTLPITSSNGTQTGAGQGAVNVNGTSYSSGIVSINSTTTGTLTFLPGVSVGSSVSNISFDYTL
jgi:hypothetical protein